MYIIVNERNFTLKMISFVHKDLPSIFKSVMFVWFYVNFLENYFD